MCITMLIIESLGNHNESCKQSTLNYLFNISLILDISKTFIIRIQKSNEGYLLSALTLILALLVLLANYRSFVFSHFA